MRSYETSQDAALGLLGETAELLQAANIDYAIVGGWIPYLFNGSNLNHPGTFDVDVLLNSGMKAAAINTLVEDMLAAGYLPAAKNKYQLFRVLKVQQQQMIFHIDFLHKAYANTDHPLLIDWGWVQSIKGPGTDVIWNNNERTIESVRFLSPNTEGNEEVEVNINFASEPGLLSCKGRSLHVQKRERDPYDVFLVISCSRDRENLINRCRQLLDGNIFRASMDCMWKGFFGKDGRAIEQAAKVLLTLNQQIDPSVEDAESIVESCLGAFFDEIGYLPEEEEIEV